MNAVLLGDRQPQLGDGAWVAPGATVAGAVRLGRRASVWYGAVVRADSDEIVALDDSNLQDGAVLHAGPDRPVAVGWRVSVGHRAVLHGCVLADDVLVGMGAIVMNGASIGEGSIVAAGAVVLEGADMSAGSMVAGVPAKVRRETTETKRASVRANARAYIRLRAEHANTCHARSNQS